MIIVYFWILYPSISIDISDSDSPNFTLYDTAMWRVMGLKTILRRLDVDFGLMINVFNNDVIIGKDMLYI